MNNIRASDEKQRLTSADLASETVMVIRKGAFEDNVEDDLPMFILRSKWRAVKHTHKGTLGSCKILAHFPEEASIVVEGVQVAGILVELLLVPAARVFQVREMDR